MDTEESKRRVKMALNRNLAKSERELRLMRLPSPPKKRQPPCRLKLTAMEKMFYSYCPRCGGPVGRHK